MIAIECCLVLLSISAFFDGAAAQSHCSSYTWGEKTDFPIELGQSVLIEGVRDFTVKIPDACSPSNILVGVTLTACDYDVDPYVTMYDPSFATVNRRGSLQFEGYVEAVEYCENYWGVGGSPGGNKVLTLQAIPKSLIGIASDDITTEARRALYRLYNRNTDPVTDARRSVARFYQRNTNVGSDDPALEVRRA